MIKKMEWEDLRSTGLVLIINQILHIFGWAIVFEVDEDSITSVFPARVNYRGFEDESISDSYLKISKYMKDNSTELYNEIKD